MSTQQLPGQILNRQTNGQILHTIQEIAQLAKKDIVPEEFHGEFLKRVVSALGAAGGVVWSLHENTLSGAFQINLQELSNELHSAENGEQQHSRLVYHLLNGPEQGTLCPPRSGFNDASGGTIGNPSSRHLLFCPVRTELETVGIVEIIQHPDTNAEAQRSHLQLLYQVSSLAADYYKNRQLRQFGERQNLWVLLEDFIRSVHQSLDLTETSYTVVNEGRRLIECDRVSVALRSGGGCKIVAVSGQDIVDKRSTAVKLLNQLASAAVRADEKVWYTGSTADFAPQVEKAVENYVDESHTKMLAVFPLFPQKKKDEENEDDGRKRKPQKPFGALIVEQINDSRIPDGMRSRMEIVASHAGSALGNAMEHHKIFLMPVWKMIGKTTSLFTSGRLPITMMVLTAIIALVCSMIFVPWNFQMYSAGTLEPIIRQKVFSPLDAEVKELFVDHNSKVQGPYKKDGTEYRGTTLLELWSPELDNEGLRLAGEYQEITEEITSLTRQTYNEGNNLSEYDKTQIVGKLETARIRLETNKNQQKIYELQRNDLWVTAPITGTAVSWDIKQRLNVKRPISRMQMLMEIADLEGPWQLELPMPEKRMGNIAEWKKRIEKDNTDARLNVEFVMATDPNKKFYGTVTEIHDRAEVRNDNGSASNSQSGLNTVLIKVALDQNALPENLRPGSECSAKIYCGQKPLGYVLFYEVIAFVQKNILFRLF